MAPLIFYSIYPETYALFQSNAYVRGYDKQSQAIKNFYRKQIIWNKFHLTFAQINVPR